MTRPYTEVTVRAVMKPLHVRERLSRGGGGGGRGKGGKG